MINTLIAFAVTIVLSLGLGAYAGYEHVTKAFEAFKTAQTALALAAQKTADDKAKKDKEVQNAIELQSQAELAGYAGYVADLLRHQRAGTNSVPRAAPGTPVAPVAAVGPGSGVADPALSCPDTASSDHVTLDALLQLREWRQYARGTGQGK
jgi:hypothetical protein